MARVSTKEIEVICFGEALVDRLGPPGGDPARDLPVEDCWGGAPANVACGLAKLGTKSAFIGRLGNDSIGESFSNLMNQTGVNLLGLQTDFQRPTRIVLVRRDLHGERTFQGFKCTDGEMSFADEAIDLSELAPTWPLINNQASWLLIGTIPLAKGSSADALSWTVQKALDQNIKIALDINWRPTFWNINHLPNDGPNPIELKKITPFLLKASLLKLAKEEAIWFFNSEDPSKISTLLPRHPDVVITDGPRPLKWFLYGFSGETEAISPNLVVDTTGAGDAFTAGLLHKLSMLSKHSATKEKIEEVVQFAAICGGLVCSGAGAIDPQPTMDDIEKFLSKLSGGLR